MNANEYLALVQMLLDKSRAGKVAWTEISGLAVKADLGSYSVTVSERDSLESPSDKDYVVALYSGGKKVDSFSDIDLRNVTDKSYQLMKELYKGALGRARGVDKVIAGLLDNLKGL